VPTQTFAPLIAVRLSSPHEAPSALLERVSTAWHVTMRSALITLGLTPAQFRLLVAAAWLGSRNDGVRQSEIAEHAGTDAVMTSEVLRTLEARGLITRQPHPTDRRAKAIAITPDGGALADRALRLVDSAEQRFFETGLPEFRALAKALKKGGRGASGQ
jgi:MarR family transcriptional regulator, organic hydroperoxide resistance regulator